MNDIPDKELYLWYKNTCHAHQVSFEEFKRNYYEFDKKLKNKTEEFKRNYYEFDKKLKNKTMEKYTPPYWDEWFMRQVYLISYKSKDKSSKIGSVIVNKNQIVKIGYNGFPVGVNDDIEERQERPLKYQFTSHSESNAVSFAAKDGVSTNECIIYTNAICCIECAKIVIQSGIKEVIYHKQFQDKWNELYRSQWEGHEKISRILFKEAGVKLTAFDKILNVNAYIDGKIINV